MVFSASRFVSILFITTCSALFNGNNGIRQVASRIQKKPLQEGQLRYIVDIDGTICTKTNSCYYDSKPIYQNIDVFNLLYEKGHQIHYWTARGANSGKNWDELTVQQLNSWGVRYNSINMGKPHYDIWIDDKAINAKHFCKDIK